MLLRSCNELLTFLDRLELLSQTYNQALDDVTKSNALIEEKIYEVETKANSADIMADTVQMSILWVFFSIRNFISFNRETHLQ